MASRSSANYLDEGGAEEQVTHHRPRLPAPKFSQRWASQGLSHSPQTSVFSVKAKAATPFPTELPWKQSRHFSGSSLLCGSSGSMLPFFSEPSTIYSFQPSVTKTVCFSCNYCAHKPLLGLGKSEPLNLPCKAYGLNS